MCYLTLFSCRAVIETKHALWVKGHCRLMLGVYADCVSLFDHMVTDENTKQRGLYEQVNVNPIHILPPGVAYTTGPGCSDD